MVNKNTSVSVKQFRLCLETTTLCRESQSRVHTMSSSSSWHQNPSHGVSFGSKALPQPSVRSTEKKLVCVKVSVSQGCKQEVPALWKYYRECWEHHLFAWMLNAKIIWDQHETLVCFLLFGSLQVWKPACVQAGPGLRHLVGSGPALLDQWQNILWNVVLSQLSLPALCMVRSCFF